MKAVILKSYGSLDNLSIEEVLKPEPKENEVLLRVHAAAINDWDWSMMKGTPFYIRLFAGFWKPKFNLIPGVDVSGTIEETGPKVSKFHQGDAVYADLSECGFGGFAEYVCAPEDALTSKPKDMSFVEAASIPHAAGLAIQGLIEVGKVQADEEVLVNGAGGGMGTIAIQLARHLGVKNIVGVDSGDKEETMRSAGYARTIDYTQSDFTRLPEKYDLILDAKTTHRPADYSRVLKEAGRYVTVGGMTSQLIRVALAEKYGGRFLPKKFAVLGLSANKDLQIVNNLYTKNELRPIIGAKFPFAKIADAIELFGSAKHKGKVIVTIINQ